MLVHFEAVLTREHTGNFLSGRSSPDIVGHAPEQSWLMQALLPLELIVGDEMDVAAKPQNVRPFLVSVPDALDFIWELTRVEARVRSIGSAEIPNLGFPHNIRGGIERA